jgi:hypothetical protein
MPHSEDRASWEPMALKSVGLVSDVVQQGGGKLTLVGGDPGEPARKPKGQE